MNICIILFLKGRKEITIYLDQISFNDLLFSAGRISEMEDMSGLVIKDDLKLHFRFSLRRDLLSCDIKRTLIGYK